MFWKLVFICFKHRSSSMVGESHEIPSKRLMMFFSSFSDCRAINIYVSEKFIHQPNIFYIIQMTSLIKFFFFLLIRKTNTFKFFFTNWIELHKRFESQMKLILFVNYATKQQQKRFFLRWCKRLECAFSFKRIHMKKNWLNNANYNSNTQKNQR